MTHPTGEFSRDELLRFAADHGFRVTPGQLHLWRDNGLVPPPRRVRPPGRRGGSESRYPASAGPQLVAAAEALAESRNFDTARWRLWWRGFDIPHPYIAAQLLAEIDELRERRHKIRGARNPDDDEAADLWAAEFEKETRARTADPRLSRLRKRVGRSQFTALLALVIQALTGEYVDHEPDELKRAAKHTGLALVDQKVLLRGASALMDSVLRESETVEAMSEQDLAQYRDELRDILDVVTWVRRSPEMVSMIVGQQLPPAVADLTIGFREEPPGPLDLVIYAALRRNPTAFSPKLVDPTVMDPLKQMFKFLKALKGSTSDKAQST